MPELPDITIYLEALQQRVVGATLQRVYVASPSLLRTWDPPLASAHGQRVTDVVRLGKRIVLALERELFLVLHLMIAGRLRWRPAGSAPPGRTGLAAFEFDCGVLILTEASARRRATLHLVRGASDLAEHDPEGLDLLTATAVQFRERLRLENHTLKRFLTAPRLVDGVGNAYSDEILHRARMSPMQWTQRLDDQAADRLLSAAVEVLVEWITRLRIETGDGFPAKVTAFREGMAVHGRYRLPCPRCGAAVQRISYVDRETNYCADCQTGGQVYADRALSQLLKQDWPRTLEEWEQIRPTRR